MLSPTRENSGTKITKILISIEIQASQIILKGKKQPNPHFGEGVCAGNGTRTIKT